MNKVLVKSGEVKLNDGGYLVTTNETPVYHEEFVAEQEHAAFIVKFAEACKGKDFEGKKADSIEAVRSSVLKGLMNGNKKEFIKAPKAPKQTINDGLMAEALAFVEHGKNSEKANRINDFLNENFQTLNKYDSFGLYFDEGIVELTAIYTMADVIKAVTQVIDLLD